MVSLCQNLAPKLLIIEFGIYKNEQIKNIVKIKETKNKYFQLLTLMFSFNSKLWKIKQTDTKDIKGTAPRAVKLKSTLLIGSSPISEGKFKNPTSWGPQ